MAKFPMSFSRLSTFENCPAQFDYLYVTKAVQDSGNVYTQYGNRVHESLEHYGKDGDEAHLTEETRQFKGVVDLLLSKSGEKHFELKMSITQDGKKCGWFDDDVWMRGIADVLIIDGDVAYCVDWKTGKVKENPTQLQLFACMVMLNFPEVNEVRTSFVWLKHQSVTDVRYKRSQFEVLWRNLMTRFSVVQEAVDIGVFEAKPSGLCRWCVAREICPDSR